MENRFALSLLDVDHWIPTDTSHQEEVLKQLIGECEPLGEAQPVIMTSDR